jgi:hypothetical protein
MTEALNEAYQQQNDRINQLQICFHLHTNTERKNYWNKYQDWLCLKLIQNENIQHWHLQDKY